MKKVTDPSILSQLNKPVTDPAILAQLNGPSDASVQEDAFRNKIKQEQLDSGGIRENIGAGMNKTIQGVKQIFGFGGTDDSIEERRKLDQELADNTTGGGLLQLGGEMVASAPITMGVGGVVAKGASMLSRVAALAAKGGKIANLGAVGRGAVEGATGALLNETTSDESDGLNATAGATIGAAMPLIAAGGGKLWRALSKKNAPNRAAKIFEEQLGPDDMHDIGFRLNTGAQTRLPLTTAAAAENAKLAALERGARSRNDAGFIQDRKVANKAWEELKKATGAADDLSNRVSDREFLMKASKEHLDSFNRPTLVRRAGNDVSDVAEALRATPEVRQSPEVSKLIGEIEVLLKHPDSSAGDFAEQYWRIGQKLDDPKLTPSQRGALMKLRDSVGQGADTASGGPNFTDMLERYKVEDSLVNEAEAAKKIRGAFVDELGTPQTKRYFGVDTPEIDSNRLRRALTQHGKNQYGDVLDPSARQSIKDLESELTRHEMFQAANAPGPAQLDIKNPLEIISTGRDNPFNYFPLVKGGANWLFKGSRQATTDAADEALMSPDMWRKMVEGYAKSNSPLKSPGFLSYRPSEYADSEYMKRLARQLLLMPGRTTAAGLGE